MSFHIPPSLFFYFWGLAPFAVYIGISRQKGQLLSNKVHRSAFLVRERSIQSIALWMRVGGEREGGGIERENGKEKKKEKRNEIKAEWRKKRETIVTVDLFMVSLIDSAQESMNELALTRLVNR